jgi:hypothetical protein
MVNAPPRDAAPSAGAAGAARRRLAVRRAVPCTMPPSRIRRCLHASWQPPRAAAPPRPQGCQRSAWVRPACTPTPQTNLVVGPELAQRPDDLLHPQLHDLPPPDVAAARAAAAGVDCVEAPAVQSSRCIRGRRGAATGVVCRCCCCCCCCCCCGRRVAAVEGGSRCGEHGLLERRSRHRKCKCNSLRHLARGGVAACCCATPPSWLPELHLRVASIVFARLQSCRRITCGEMPARCSGAAAK